MTVACRLLLFAIAWAGCSPMAVAAGDADILRPEQAFRYAAVADGEEIVVTWQIEPEHYLYKERMGYASATAGVQLGAPMLPDGKPYEDEFFGRMEIYRGAVAVRIPILSRPPDANTLELEIKSQGCADIGLCYPPQTWVANIELDPAPPGGKHNSLLTGTPARGGVDEPLPPDQAFSPLVEVIDPFRVRVTWMIEPGYYLYRDSLRASTVSDIVQLGRVELPRGTAKWDEHFGDTEVFYGTATMEITASRGAPEPVEFELALDYQGCKEDSICYPPERRMELVALPLAASDDPPRSADAVPMVSEQDRLSRLITGASLPIVLLTFVGLGLLLSFTPCVLPMVPILSGIIAGQGRNITTARAFALSLTYVLGMACTYTIAGALFGAAGSQIQAVLQKPWIIWSVAALFVALALSMFGLYELQMPAAIQNRLTAAGSRQKTGTFVGTAVMGALSALVVTTCIAPPLVAALTVIAGAGDVTRGALALFALSIGMGVPLLVIGTSAGRLLPRAGAWMDSIKFFFGFMMLGLAIWMLDRVLPGVIIMLLWAILAVSAGVWLGAFDRFEPPVGAARRAGKAVGLLAVVYGAALLVGLLGGSQDPLQPLRLQGSTTTHEELEFRLIKTVDDLDLQLAQARQSNRGVMLDFYADWCVSCKEMERYTFADARVKKALGDTVLLQADVTANDDADRALLKRFGIFGPPTIVFFSPDGRERDEYRVVGYMTADEFSQHAARALTKGPAS